jgi:hypothetical protein
MRFVVSPGVFGVLSLVGYVPWSLSLEWGGVGGVKSGFLVGVGGRWWRGSRYQSQAEKVKVGVAPSWQRAQSPVT